MSVATYAQTTVSALVPLWTGREVRALREARRVSVRAFAAHLGVSDRMVSKWEAGGEGIRPRPVNQAALDTSLALASAEERRRFAHLVGGQALSGNRPARIATPTYSACHVVRHPVDGKLMTMIDAGPFRVGAGRKPVWLPGFYIDVHATSHADYARFLAATGHPPPAHWPGGTYVITDQAGALHDDPVTGLGRADAQAYARWASKELPTVTQWDRAARGVEGFVTAEVWEWCRVDTQRRPGAKCEPGGGFRCTTPVMDMLALLAI